MADALKEALLRIDEVRFRTGLSRTQLYSLIAQGRFPAGIPLVEGSRAKGWPESEVATFIAGRIAAARGQS